MNVGNRKWLRALYVSGILAVSLLISFYLVRMMTWQ